MIKVDLDFKESLQVIREQGYYLMSLSKKYYTHPFAFNPYPRGTYGSEAFRLGCADHEFK